MAEKQFWIGGYPNKNSAFFSGEKANARKIGPRFGQQPNKKAQNGPLT